MPTVRIVGPGRAGTSFADALATRGWQVADPVFRGDDPGPAAHGVDLCVIATPDAVIESVVAAVEPDPSAAVAHLAGSLGADVLRPHPRRVAIHPLASLPDRHTGARTLLQGCWWAVEGDLLGFEIVAALGGRAVVPRDRVAYHAAACVAANHLVTLLAQVERIAAQAGVPAEAFYDLAAGALANARAGGATRALTGPAARGDLPTLERHLAALGAGEHDLYLALASAAAHLAGRDLVPCS